MKRIFKYELEIIEEQTIDLPLSPIFISVMAQEDQVVLYALVDDEKETRPNVIRIVGTGNPFMDYDECVYLGTVQQYGYVWHIFSKRVEVNNATLPTN